MGDEDAANELCRMFFRKRARIWVGDADWRNETTPFGLQGETYHLGRHSFHVRNHGKSVYFMPSRHLLETLRQVIRQITDQQDADHSARVTSLLLRRAAP